ncbi:MAG: DMT family transporter [Phycisphaerales bacterium]
MTYVYLALAILCEAGWAIGMKASHGLSRPLPTAITAVLYILSLIFLALATRRLDLGTTYAIWAGLGAVLIAIAGVVAFSESVSPLKVASIAFIIIGVVGLQLASPHAAPATP